MEVIILAGGRGERLKSVVSEVPKPLAPIAGRPFLERLMDHWRREGVTHFVLAVGFKHQLIEKHFGREYKGVPVSYSVENEPLGTAGGLLLALPHLKGMGPFLVLNGDTYFEVPLADLRTSYAQKKADWSMALVQVKRNSRYGAIEIDSHERIQSLQLDAPPSEHILINGGVYLMNRDILAADRSVTPRKMSLESELVPRLIREGKRLFGFQSRGQFIDIGIPTDYHAACEWFLKKDNEMQHTVE